MGKSSAMKGPAMAPREREERREPRPRAEAPRKPRRERASSRGDMGASWCRRKSMAFRERILLPRIGVQSTRRMS
jgi:hypothetical protein